MPTYVILGEYTEQGVENIKDSPDRLDAAKELAASMDGEITEFYLTFGQYDFVVIAEGPDDETAAQMVMTVSQDGAVRTETLKAFPEAEYRDVIAGLP